MTGEIVNLILEDFKKLKDKERATHHLKFFKTEKGGYGEGDKFLGLTIPQIRTLSKKYYNLVSLEELEKTIGNEYHEIRLFTLLCLIAKVEKNKDNEEFKKIINFYIKNIDYVNNWDLVDLSAPYLVGKYCYSTNNYNIIKDFANDKYNKNKKPLTKLWSERIAIVSNLYLVRKEKFNISIELCEFFLEHRHDLIHKASGWLLREVGKKDKKILCDFLDIYRKKMPRTMLRYSIERLEKKEKEKYMRR